MKVIIGSYLGKNVIIVTKTGSIIKGHVKVRDTGNYDGKLILDEQVFLITHGASHACESLEVELGEIEIIGLTKEL